MGVEQAGQQGFLPAARLLCVVLVTWRHYMAYQGCRLASPVDVSCLFFQGAHLLPEGFGVTATECVNEERCPVL